MKRHSDTSHLPDLRHRGRFSKSALLLGVAASLGFPLGCTTTEGEAGAPRASSVRFPVEAYFEEMLDQNGDGVLTRAEIRACDPHCTRYDRDGDGIVTWEEFVADPMDVSSAIEMIFHGPEHFVAERAALDIDGDGEVSWSEFYNPQMAAFAPNNYDPATATWRDAPASIPTPAIQTGAQTMREAAAATAAAAAGGLPVGRYNCHYTHMMQVIPAGTLISILPGGRYQYLDEGTGNYAYDAATGALQWLSGPFAGSGVTGEFTYRETDGRPLIRLKLQGAGVNQRGEPATQTNRCVGPAQ